MAMLAPNEPQKYYFQKEQKTVSTLKNAENLYRYELSKIKGNRSDIELDFTTLPFSPMKNISMGCSCLTSYSAIACLQEPHGGVGISTV